MSEKRSELRERLFKLRSAASANSTGFATISIEALNDVDAAAKAIESELAQARHDQWIVWEGDESEGRWRCLMCGAKRQGEDDTGPEGLEHAYNCGMVGTTIWAFDKIIQARNDLEAQRAELALLRSKYDELLYAVATKHENETRHETALRYIREQENKPSGPASMELIKEQEV